IVIVDEFHHAAAATYERLLQYARPRVLLGLTATPERADGESVLGWFDGRVASESRLWNALDESLLCPFQYFGVGGAPDLRGVRWSRGRYDTTALSNVYTADHLFATRVLQETRAKVRDITTMRALGFCVDIKHAMFMTERFNEAGVKARHLSGRSSSAERDEAVHLLAAGELQIVFTVDLFNEGVDLPAVDTLLFLRPTESATIFLQQLGRGLRRAPGKECCTVLDFIGHANRRFRFDARYRAIIGGTRRQIERTVEDGFPSLPSGCFIHLDREAQIVVLENVRAALRAGRSALIDDVKALAARDDEPPTLRAFLNATELDLEDLYTKTWCWTSVLRKAGLETSAPDPGDAAVERALSRMLHVDDDRLERFEQFLSRSRAPAGDASDPYQRLLFILTGHMRDPYDKLGDTWRHLWSRAPLHRELLELIAILRDRRRRVPSPLDAPPLANVPLRVHGTYSRDEVFAAFDERSSKNGVKRTQGGIFNVERYKTELLFVELDKRDKDYTPSTLYNDYPVTPTQFHWESQASCHAKTAAGRRYLNATPGSDQHVLLFVRQRRRDARGQVNPYLLLGLCDLLDHRGARPMQVDWRLRVPMPSWFFQETKVAGG
ncbi:MAG: DUF3427 domain-containing protein, partial [Myxococcales bacterium]|nr:DUF3427 domain-containing protein [Myxococcales bacterium]